MSPLNMTMSFSFPEMPTNLKDNAFNTAHKLAAKKSLVVFKNNTTKRFSGKMNNELDWASRDSDYEFYKSFRNLNGSHHRLTGKTMARFRRGQIKTSTRGGKKSMRYKITGLGFQYNFRRRQGRGIDYKQEMRAVADSEMKKIASIYTASYINNIMHNVELRRKTKKRKVIRT